MYVNNPSRANLFYSFPMLSHLVTMTRHIRALSHFLARFLAFSNPLPK